MPAKLEIDKAPEDILELSNEEILEEFIATLEASGASPDTIKSYQSAISDFLEFIGDKPLRQITIRDIIKWKNHRLRNGFPRSKTMDRKAWQTTLHYYTLFLNRFFEWLGIKIRVPKVKKPPRQIKILTDEEVARLAAVANDPLDKLIISLLLDTGLRSKELLGIRVKDIDFNNKTINVETTKYGVSRRVIITEKTLELIKAWITINNLKENDKLIPLTYSGLYKRIKKLGRKAGIPLSKIRPHILRHTFATIALRKGLSLPSLQRILGHADIKTTQVYLHLTIDDIKKEYERTLENRNDIICPKCFRKIPSDALYCPYCGAPLNNTRAELAKT